VPHIEFQVYCAECGNGLCNETEVKSGRYEPEVHVAPCEKCLKKAYDEGYDEGYCEGEEAGGGSE
jgi:hypothetical protein